jgi:hypothetical protein
MSPREERLARNEVLFREVNDRIAELGPGNPDGEFHIVYTIEDIEDVVERHGSYDVVEKHADIMASGGRS